MSAIGVIGGTGVYDPSIFENIHEESLVTPYGEIDYVQGTYHGKTVIFVARHGKDHTIPPHKINYRANIWGSISVPQGVIVICQYCLKSTISFNRGIKGKGFLVQNAIPSTIS